MVAMVTATGMVMVGSMRGRTARAVAIKAAVVVPLKTVRAMAVWSTISSTAAVLGRAVVLRSLEPCPGGRGVRPAAVVRARTVVLVVRVPVMRLAVVRRGRRTTVAVVAMAMVSGWTVGVMMAVRTVGLRGRRRRRREGVPVSRRRGRAMVAMMARRSVGSLRVVRAMIPGTTVVVGVMTVKGISEGASAVDRAVAGRQARLIVVVVLRLRDGVKVEIGGLLLHLVNRVLGRRGLGDVR